MADQAPSRAVVTGGAGFLGSHICERLLADGWEVVCLDNFLTGTPANVEHLLPNPQFRMIRANVTDYVHVAGHVDVIYHFASPASPIDYLQLPIQTMKVGSVGTLHMLGMAKDKGARFVLASTSEAYGDPEVHPQPESYWGNVNPVGPRGVYDEAKRFAEALTMAYCRYHGVDTGIVRIFNSVLADEQLLYDDGVSLRRETAQQLADRLAGAVTPLSGFSVPAFAANSKMEAAETTWFVGHPTEQRCFEVRTRYGRSIKVTGDHSLFVEGPDGAPIARPVTELKVGDRVAIAGRIEVPARDRSSVDMLDVVAASGRDPWRIKVSWWGTRRWVENYRPVIVGLVTARNGGSRQSAHGQVNRWVREDEVPLAVVQQLGYVPHLPVGTTIRIAGGGQKHWFQRRIAITDEMLWLFGLFIAEGTLDRRPPKNVGVSISCDNETLERAEKVFHRDLDLDVTWGTGSEARAGYIRANSSLLLDLFDYLEFAQEKNLPGWVLGLPLQRLGWLLEGYREGDGVHSGLKFDAAERHEFSTISDRLKDDLIVALTRFGLVPSVGRYLTRCPQVATGCTKEHWFWRLTLCKVDPWSPLDWHRGVTQTIQARRTGDLVWAVIKDIIEVPATPLVYDFVVPGRENFVAGTGVLAHNTHGPRMRPNDGRAIPTFIRQALKNEPITVAGDGLQTRSIQYVDDLVEGVVRMAASDHPGPINIGTPHEVTMLELASTIKALCGSSSEIAFIPRPEDDPMVRNPDITLAREVLGWEPVVPFEEGLKRTIAWFREQHLD